MDIVAILGFGAIGLGFLLAFLTYQLLRRERKNNRPIYVFQFFCFMLVLIGAFLQYASSLGNDTSQDLRIEISNIQSRLDTAISIMKTINEPIPGSIKDLNSVNTVLTGLSCSGGSHGVPLHGGKGPANAALNTKVIGHLSAAKNSIDLFLSDG